MLTQKDLDEVEKIVDERIEDKTRNLPTKDEFFGKMDEVMGELKLIREETSVLSGLHEKVNDHEERIEKIEKKLRIQPSI
ncbi:hypothetical protein A2863_01090 [Candidatus Woesebacteria bacterium RIFCSPHIGHO2_01_FULL_38_9b]|uniref:Uncharacterized protein n=1 Tax=Candidatus Woesebacteria bacterium RIFCSPHIGHO2_01_FULL_38_9b TaxID=1802493 RepID=A0A1F7Y138_9BACT|nr:MAG: hypothetical protein A2863_01090 [Candidatus Woesebacteria bacterium RIFCSPHIGHO2_01_FULL_38_9b]